VEGVRFSSGKLVNHRLPRGIPAASELPLRDEALAFRAAGDTLTVAAENGLRQVDLVLQGGHTSTLNRIQPNGFVQRWCCVLKLDS
jgi:hypothetical protein